MRWPFRGVRLRNGLRGGISTHVKGLPPSEKGNIPFLSLDRLPALENNQRQFIVNVQAQ